jgi:hypothetical protein
VKRHADGLHVWGAVGGIRIWLARCDTSEIRAAGRSRGGDGERGSGTDGRAPHDRERRRDLATGMWAERSKGQIR